MVTYEVSATVAAAVADKYEQYMKQHLRSVLASGCFTTASLERAGAGKYRASYHAKSRHDVDRYLRDHAEALRKDFADHVPSGVELGRDTWEQLVSVSA